MKVIKVAVPEQLHYSDPRKVCQAIVDAFSTYYENVLPACPPDKMGNLLSESAYMQKLIYQLIADYNGRTFRKHIEIPTGAQEEFLLEGVHGFETTIRTFNLVWDSFLYYYKERNALFELSDLFPIITIRDGIITLITRYFTEWLIQRIKK